ncbi:MAG: hypothetical protein U0670_23525 [Anaerolineae bacterium]
MEQWLSRFVIEGSIFTVLLAVFIIGTLIYNKRLWMQDYPKEIQALQPPLTVREKRERVVLALGLFVLLFGGLFVSNAGLKAANGGTLPFLNAYLNAYGLWSLFNLFDAVVIDWWFGAVMAAPFMIMPGSEGYMHLYRDKRMHLINFLKGVVGGLILCVPIALISTIL